MFSKGVNKICLALALSVAVASCSEERRPPDTEFEVKLEKGECVARIDDQFKDYAEGRMSKAGVEAFWNCMADTMVDFQRLTSGEGDGGDKYSANGLRLFLHTFTGGRILSTPLMNSIMEIKRVLLSGTIQHLTDAELQDLQNLLVELKGITVDLQPYAKLIFAENLPNATEAEVAQAGQALAMAAKRLGAWLDRHKQAYRVEHLEKLFSSLADWMEADSDSRETVAKIGRLAPAIGVAKRILISGSAKEFEGENWVTLTQMLGQAGRLLVDFRHAFKNDLNSGMVTGLMPHALTVATAILENAIRKRGGPLPFSDFEDLFKKIEDSQALGKEFTLKSLKPAFEWLVIRGFGDGAVTDKLTMDHLARLRRHQTVWDQTLKRVNGMPVPDFPEWQEFEGVLNRSVPLNWDSEGRMQIVRNGPSTWTQPNMRRMVWPFAILHWLKEAYVGAGTTLTEAQMMDAVKEVLPMLQNFGWLGHSKLSIGKRLVREADLFIFPSNGDSLLDLPEAAHYLAMVASNFRMAEVWLEDAQSVCLGKESSCVRKAALSPDSRAFEPMPELRATIMAQPADNFVKYMRLAEETILGKVVSGEYGTGDLLQVLQLLQYVDIFLTFYDVDQTQKINLNESLVAYQKYGPTLARLVGGGRLPPDEILAFYTFMMKYGETPATMLGGDLYFVNWKLKRNDWAFEAERPVLLGILNALSKL